MTKFYFIRHGKTQWNLEGKYQGASGDSPLLKESYDDIKQLSNYLFNVKFTKAYSSPLKRAKITAKTLIKDLKQDIPLIIDNDLKEFNLGLMEGQKFTDMESMYPYVIFAFRNKPEDYDNEIINGESFSSVINRTNKLIKSIAKDSKDQDNFIIVSHGAALVAMIKSLLGENIEDLRKNGGLSNTSVTILNTNDFGESFNLIDWNDTSFLTKKSDPTDVI